MISLLGPQWYPLPLFLLGSPYQNRALEKRVPLLKGYGGLFFLGCFFCFFLGFFFVSVVADHVWCLLLFSLVLLAGFCFLLFAFCSLLSASLFLLLLFLLLAFCFLSLLLSACCFWLHALCFLCLVFAFCFLLSAFMCFGQKARTVATRLLLLLLLLLL